MLIRVPGDHGSATVEETDDLKAFSVVVEGDPSDADVQASLGDLGTLDAGTHAWISIDRLRAASDRAADATWQAGFDGMVGYATSKGWVSEDGSALRAHLERAAST